MSTWTGLTTFTRDTLISCWVYNKHYLPVNPAEKLYQVKPHVWQWGVEMPPDMFVCFYFTQPFFVISLFSSNLSKYCTTWRTWGHRLSLYFLYSPTFFLKVKFFFLQKYLITAAPSGIDFQQQFVQAPTSRLSSWSVGIRSTDNQSAL